MYHAAAGIRTAHQLSAKEPGLCSSLLTLLGLGVSRTYQTCLVALGARPNSLWQYLSVAIILEIRHSPPEPPGMNSNLPIACLLLTHRIVRCARARIHTSGGSGTWRASQVAHGKFPLVCESLVASGIGLVHLSA